MGGGGDKEDKEEFHEGTHVKGFWVKQEKFFPFPPFHFLLPNAQFAMPHAQLPIPHFMLRALTIARK